MSPAEQRRAQRLAALATLRDEVGSLREEARRQHEQRARAAGIRRQEVQEFIDETCRVSRLQAAQQDSRRRQEDAAQRREVTASFLEQRQAHRLAAKEVDARDRREQQLARQRDAEAFRNEVTTDCMQQWKTAREKRHDSLCQIFNWVETTTGVRRRPVCPEHAEIPVKVPVERPMKVPVKRRPFALRKIEGIGPKCEELLKAAGVSTVELLATANVDELREILRTGGPRFNAVDPSSWPEQAKLAASGQFEALRALQDQLHGGRRA